MAADERFHLPTEEEINQLLTDKDSMNTKKSTQLSIRCFRSFLQEQNGTDVEFEAYTLDRLNSSLKSFYVGARKTDGTHYKKTALQNIRYGLKRYLKEKRKIDILSDSAFTESNEVFKAVAVNLKKRGLGTVEHHPPIAECDLKKLYSGDTPVFDINTPYGLQRKVWFDLTLYLCRRGRENLREMKKETFKVAVDDSGRKFVYQNIEEMDKNHRADNENAVTEGRMYKIQGSPCCPVTSFEKYIAKLNPNRDDLWQRPKDEFSTEDEIWYINAPVGKNTLSKLMVEISKLAKLSCEYTNHSVRATSITLMDISGISGRHIIKVTGHSSEASLKHYSRFCSVGKKREMSDTLSSALGQSEETRCQTENLPDLNLENINDIFNEDFEIQPVNNSNDSNLDNVLRELNNNENKTVVKTQNQTDVWNSNTGFLNFRPSFSDHCSVTININVKR
ncbi:hypothetical protein ScPMuIL_005498 [Solemya velum]